MSLKLILISMGIFSFLFNSKITISNPNNFEIIAQVKGDLDLDGKEEIIVVYNTNDKNPFGKKRLLQIFKIKDSEPTLWIESNYALGRSEENGVKDNIVELKIENGDLIIINSQLSNWQLIQENRYRLIENSFQLVDYKSKYGKKGKYWINISYSSISENLEFIKSYENNEKKIEIENLKLKKLDLNLKNRTKKHIEFTTPKYQYEWSI